MNISVRNAYWAITWAGTTFAKLVLKDVHTAKMGPRAKPVPSKTCTSTKRNCNARYVPMAARHA